MKKYFTHSCVDIHLPSEAPPTVKYKINTDDNGKEKIIYVY